MRAGNFMVGFISYVNKGEKGTTTQKDNAT
jgi:hypothetical protein